MFEFGVGKDVEKMWSILADERLAIMEVGRHPWNRKSRENVCFTRREVGVGKVAAHVCLPLFVKKIENQC